MARRIALGLGVAAVLVVSGCSSGASGDTATTASSAPDVSLVPITPIEATNLGGSPLDKETLQRTALTLSDLPADFDIVPDPVEDLGLAPAPSTSDSDKSTTNPAACAAVLAPIATQIPGSVASITKMFAGPDFTSIDQDSASFADGAAAATAFRTMQETLAGCAEYSGTDADGTTVSYRVGAAHQPSVGAAHQPSVGAAHQPSVGDASFSYRIITTSEGFTLVADVVVAAVGTTLTQLSATAPTPIAPEVLGSMAVTAAQRLHVPTP